MLFRLLVVSFITAQVTILTPTSLKSMLQSVNPNQSEVRYSLGNFGNPPYGSAIIGSLYLPEDTWACSKLSLPTDVYPEIVLILRGNCEFRIKVKNVEATGAKAVLVIDNKEELVETVVMGGDTEGSSIPALLISKNEGQIIKTAVENGEVQVKIHFEIRKSEYVVLDLWSSSADLKSLQFLSQFSRFSPKFPKSQLDFRVHYALWSCFECQDLNFTLDKADCVSGGRYCAPDPDGSGPLSGRNVLLEDLREICVLQSISREDNYRKWFDYMASFSQSCRLDLTESCAISVMKQVSVDSAKVMKCVNESFYPGEVAYADNYLLAKELNAWKTLSPGYFPAILVNEVAYRGAWEGVAVAKVICASFAINPSGCKELEEEGKDTGPAQPDKALWVVVAVAVVLVCVTLIGYRICLRRRLKRTIDSEVQAALRSYRPLVTELTPSQ